MLEKEEIKKEPTVYLLQEIPGTSVGRPKFKIMGDSKVATAADGERGIDISFDKEHMLSLFPEEDPFNEVESMEIAGKTVYYNDYLAENKLLKEVTFADVKAAAEKKPGYEGEEGEDGFSIPYEFGTINMYNRHLQYTLIIDTIDPYNRHLQ